MADPAVSIIIPTHNRADLLREAVDSVLSQTFADWEMLIVDDGSTDDTVHYAASLRDSRIQLIELPHSGLPGRVRNAGIARARGEFIAFLDSDDLWEPRKLEVQVAALRRQPDMRWSSTFVRWIDAHGRAVWTTAEMRKHAKSGWLFEQLINGTGWVATPTILVERALLREAGGFDESLPFSQDLQLWFRLSQRSPIWVVQEPLAAVRLHAGNTRKSQGASGWECSVRVYDALVRDPALRPYRSATLRMRARGTAALADRYRADADYRKAFAALWRALPTGALLATWWMALVKTALHPFVPRRLLRAYHRRVEMGRESRQF